MPTLIRLIVVLLVLVGIGYGAMFALVMTVHPGDKDVTIRIPARDLVPNQQIERREINTGAKPAAAPDTAPAGGSTGTAAPAQQTAPAITQDEPDDNSPDIQTLAPGNE